MEENVIIYMNEIKLKQYRSTNYRKDGVRIETMILLNDERVMNVT